MDHIETAILNCYGIREAEQNMVFAARLTQHGHTIQSMADLMDLYHQSYSQKTVENIAGLPHPTVQKFMVITVAESLCALFSINAPHTEQCTCHLIAPDPI